MKVLYISNALTHYYNLVLSKLNSEPEIELVAIAPSEQGVSVGAGVYQTQEGINFKVIRLEEQRKLGLYTTFKGLGAVIGRERPDIVVVGEIHLRAFIFDLPVVFAMKKIRAALILKSIPFHYVLYTDALKNIKEKGVEIASLPPIVNHLLQKIGLLRTAKRAALHINKVAFNRPDAHVNYVEAYQFWQSYGIAREKIFITRNSPDTDLLFNIKESLLNEPPILPPNACRLLHVGRLVEWKRVDLLLRAFSRVRARFPGAELLVIGTGPEQTRLKQLAGDLHLGSSVTFTGGIYEPRELAQYFMASSLYILAGMGGLSINEAMCYGLPILCSVCDGTEKILVREGVNGRYFEDGDEDDLTEKIAWFLERQDQLPQMGARSAEIIRNEVNIHTVIDGYKKAFRYAQRQ